MGERKVQCKYYPADFDPKNVPKRKNFKDEQIKVRIMIPFTVCCTCCSEFIYRGTKFTSRKEDVDNEDYLGLRIFRFYIKCPNCLQEIVFKTDPKNSDYCLELGATRNYEPWKQNDEIEALKQAERDAAEKGDTMKALENRTLESKREMDILDGLEEIMVRNTCVVGNGLESWLEKKKREDDAALQKKLAQNQEEDQIAAEEFNHKKAEIVNRLDSSDSDTQTDLAKTSTKTSFGFGELVAAAEDDKPKPVLRLLKRKKDDGEKKKKKKDKKNKKDKK